MTDLGSKIIALLLAIST
ncbi:hypothetical protein E2320_003514, partial [Naja naja]